MNEIQFKQGPAKWKPITPQWNLCSINMFRCEIMGIFASWASTNKYLFPNLFLCSPIDLNDRMLMMKIWAQGGILKQRKAPQSFCKKGLISIHHIILDPISYFKLHLILLQSFCIYVVTISIILNSTRGEMLKTWLDTNSVPISSVQSSFQFITSQTSCI